MVVSRCGLNESRICLPTRCALNIHFFVRCDAAVPTVLCQNADLMTGRRHLRRIWSASTCSSTFLLEALRCEISCEHLLRAVVLLRASWVTEPIRMLLRTVLVVNFELFRSLQFVTLVFMVCWICKSNCNYTCQSSHWHNDCSLLALVRSTCYVRVAKLKFRITQSPNLNFCHERNSR